MGLVRHVLACGLFLVVSISAYAECLEKFCVSDVVIDSSNRVGTISKIDSGVITYSSGYSSYTATPAYLTKAIISSKYGVDSHVLVSGNRVGKVIRAFEDGRVQCSIGYSSYIENSPVPSVQAFNGISADSIVIDSNNTIGKVNIVFENGVVQYHSGYSDYLSKDISPETTEVSGIRKDVTMLDNSVPRSGTANYVFKNGKISYRSGYSNYITIDGSAAVKELNGISSGTIVIDENDRIGTVEYIFANGFAQYKSGYNPYISKQVSPEIDVVNGVRKDATMLDNSQSRSGTANHVFRNGKISYRSGYSNYLTTNASAVVQELNGITSGTIVLDEADRIGTVSYIFANGVAQYRAGYSDYLSSKISRELATIGELSKGMVILTGEDKVGTISYLFENGKLSMHSGYSNYIMAQSAAIPEVNTHPKYNKNDYYMTKSFACGQVSHFFKNEKIELGGQVVSELFGEVSELSGLTKGTKVRDMFKRTGQINRVFENGGVQYTVDEQDGMEKIENAVGRIYDASSKDNKESWLANLANQLIISDEIGFYWTLAAFVMSVDSYEQNVKDLITYMDDNKNVISDEKIRAKVRKFLSEKPEQDEPQTPPSNGGADNGGVNNGGNGDQSNIMLVALSDRSFRETVAKVLATSNIPPYAIVDKGTGKPAITIDIDEHKNFFATSCFINVSGGTKTLARDVKVPTLLRKHPCSRTLKKVLRSYLSE